MDDIIPCSVILNIFSIGLILFQVKALQYHRKSSGKGREPYTGGLGILLGVMITF